MERLRRWLDDEERTQLWLADQVGVSEGAVSQWVTGRVTPKTKTLERISQVTGLSMNELIEKEAA